MRIDSLKPGSTVLMDFNGKDETAIFVGIDGEGDERHAKFMQAFKEGDALYSWDAYRYNGRWAFGTSAEPLRLLSVCATL